MWKEEHVVALDSSSIETVQIQKPLHLGITALRKGKNKEETGY